MDMTSERLIERGESVAKELKLLLEMEPDWADKTFRELSEILSDALKEARDSNESIEGVSGND